MTLNKPQLLKFTLRLGALYYLIGAVVHYFGLTLFPFYDSRLYAPYHDSVIALVAVILMILLLVTANNPVRNIDTLKVIIACAILGSIFSIVIVFKVDFTALGAPDKANQTIVEGLLGFVFVGLLLWFYPKGIKQ